MASLTDTAHSLANRTLTKKDEPLNLDAPEIPMRSRFPENRATACDNVQSLSKALYFDNAFSRGENQNRLLTSHDVSDPNDPRLNDIRIIFEKKSSKSINFPTYALAMGPFSLEQRIEACRKVNRHWSYARISRHLDCSYAKVRFTLNPKAAARAVAKYQEKRWKIRTGRKLDFAGPSVRLQKLFKYNATAKLKWHLRQLIHLTISKQDRGYYRPLDFYTGTSIECVRKQIQSHFHRKLSWKSLGVDWMIGHQVPREEFDLNKKWQQSMLFHYSNLIPVPFQPKAKELAPEVINSEMNRLYNEVWYGDGKSHFRYFDVSQLEEGFDGSPRPPWAYRNKAVTKYAKHIESLYEARDKEAIMTRKRLGLSLTSLDDLIKGRRSQG